MDDRNLIEKLRATRPDYDSEGMLHRLLVDSYTGGGGFGNGRVPVQAAPFWGRASYEFSFSWMASYTAPVIIGQAARQTWSYLNAHRGEDQVSYNDRVNNSIYSNPVEQIVDLTNSFLCADDAQRENMPLQLDQWAKNADQAGRHISAIVRDATMKGQLVGLCYVIVDLPSGPPAANLAESKARNIAPFVTTLWPQEVLDYSVAADGTFKMIKIVSHHETEVASIFDERKTIERIMVWFPDRWERYDIESDRNGDRLVPLKDYERTGKNPFGEVPVAVFRWRDPVGNGRTPTGHPQIGTVAKLAHKLFNQQSELDDLLRRQTFGQLVVPAASDQGQTSSPGQISVGAGNALQEPEWGKGITRYIQPDGANAAGYERAIERTVAAIYRTAMIDRGESQHAETAESRKQRFVQTNAMLGNAASHMDQLEMQIYRLVATVIGGPALVAELDKVSVHRKREYADEIVSTLLDSVIKALDKLPLGGLGRAALGRASMRAILPNMSQADRRAIDDEIESVSKAEPGAEAPRASYPIDTDSDKAKGAESPSARAVLDDLPGTVPSSFLISGK